jgi:hypothetical protein
MLAVETHIGCFNNELFSIDKEKILRNHNATTMTYEKKLNGYKDQKNETLEGGRGMYLSYGHHIPVWGVPLTHLWTMGWEATTSCNT